VLASIFFPFTNLQHLVLGYVSTALRLKIYTCHH